MTSLAEENKEIAIKFFEALSSGSETYLDFYNDDSIIWTAGDNAIGGTRSKKEIIDFAQGILAAFPAGILFNIEYFFPKKGHKNSIASEGSDTYNASMLALLIVVDKLIMTS